MRTQRKRLNLALLTSKLVGTPYKLGGTGKDGLDCYSLFLAACDFWGIKDIPVIFEGLTLANYPEEFTRDPEGTKQKLFRFLGTIGLKEVAPNRTFAGDLLVTVTKISNIPGIGIHGGNDYILASYLDRGVRLMPIRGYTILKAYRMV